jgi:hypothetical protein
VRAYDPINAVADFSASASSSNAILAWTAGVSDSDFSGVTIRRSTSGFPVNATDGTLVTSSDIGTSFVDSGLADGTYYYAIFNQTLDSYYSTGVTTTVTIDATPPTSPTLHASATGTTVNLAWDVPSETASFVLRRSTSAFPVSVNDGSAVTTTDASLTSLTEAGLADGTYYYAIFAGDARNNYSSAGTTSALIDTTAPAAPTGFSAWVSGSTVNLTWSNPTDPDFVSSTVRRSSSGFPVLLTDGTLVTSTGGTNFSDTALADATYYYSLFAADAYGNFSNPVTSSATLATATTPLVVSRIVMVPAGFSISAPYTPPHRIYAERLI